MDYPSPPSSNADSMDSHGVEWNRNPMPIRIYAGDVVNPSYVILEFIASGRIGAVWRAKSIPTNKQVAIKIMYHRGETLQASRARELTKLLHNSSSTAARLFCEVIASTSYHGHQCLVFNLYGITLRGLLSRPQLFPLPFRQFRTIILQICKGSAFLHGIGFIHTDLKPENILLQEDTTVNVRDFNDHGEFYERTILRNYEIKIIDVEDSCSTSHVLRHIAGSTRYRAPEISIGIAWGPAVDVFAIGCITFELYTGEPLLPGTTNLRDIFACLEQVVGRFSLPFASRVSYLHPGLFEPGNPPRIRQSGLSADRTCIEMFITETLIRWKLIRRPDITEFIKLCANPDPAKRFTAQKALQHRFVCYNVQEKDIV